MGSRVCGPRPFPRDQEETDERAREQSYEDRWGHVTAEKSPISAASLTSPRPIPRG